jgi:hypothetical protein
LGAEGGLRRQGRRLPGLAPGSSLLLRAMRRPWARRFPGRHARGGSRSQRLGALGDAYWL